MSLVPGARSGRFGKSLQLETVLNVPPLLLIQEISAASRATGPSTANAKIANQRLQTRFTQRRDRVLNIMTLPAARKNAAAVWQDSRNRIQIVRPPGARRKTPMPRRNPRIRVWLRPES